MPHNHINRIKRDARGYLWICTDEGLARFDGYRFINYGTAQGLPNLTVNDFVETRDGTYWVATDGAPSNSVNAFFLDSQRRFWLATSSSRLHRVDEVTDNRLRLTTWDVTKGFATNEVWSITEDHWGRLYAGTGRGVDRLDPATGFIRHFTTADGLAKGEVRVSLRDRQNQLWFVTEQGVSRLLPKLEETPAAPPALITALRINGNPAPVSELGEVKLENLTFAPGQNSVQIDFVSLDFSTGAKLHYQYQLNAQEWSA